MKRLAPLLAVVLLPLHAAAQATQATQATQDARQPLSNAWWTGSLLSNGAGTLPPGHWLIEPYLYDVITAHSRSVGTSSYILYGLVHRLTVGFIPTAGIGAGPQFGDVTGVVQFGLTQFHEGSLLPTSSIALREVLPTGKYDNLGNRPDNGLGAGAYTTQIALYTQDYFWMPNGRILRVRFGATQSVYSTTVTINGVSIYGTGQDFHGHANPGPSTAFNAAAEYSVTQRLVFAFDVDWNVNFNTPVTGFNARFNSGSSTPLGFAPGIEYNWSPRYGVIAGTRIIPAMRNVTPSVTPVMAVNMVL